MIIQPARRTETVKEYYFSRKNREIAALNIERASKGLDPVINLGIGSPNGVPPMGAIERLGAAARDPKSHGYQSYQGLPALKEAFAAWYQRYYGVTLDPVSEIQPLVGSKEGILIASLTFLNEGDKVLIPDPGYPTYTSAALLCGAQVVKYDLTEATHWFPDFEALEAMDLSGVKMMWTNYPGMPTGAKATPELYARLVEFGRRHGILIVNDNPYSFILNEQPLSMLAVPGAKECCLEMNSLSKAHNMAGWRIGMVAGEADYIREILKVKSQMDSGMFKPMQLAAVEALAEGPDWFTALNAEYRRRKDIIWKIYDLLGLHYDRNTAGLFVWGRIDNVAPDGERSRGEVLSDKLLAEAGVFLTPGFVFGRNGENYIRASLCADVPVLEKALEKIEKVVR